MTSARTCALIRPVISAVPVKSPCCNGSRLLNEKPSMSRGVVSAIAVGALLFVLRYALFIDFTVFGVHPELLLLFAVCCGLAGGPNYGVVAGFVAGLVADAFLT